MRILLFFCFTVIISCTGPVDVKVNRVSPENSLPSEIKDGRVNKSGRQMNWGTTLVRLVSVDNTQYNGEKTLFTVSISDTENSPLNIIPSAGTIESSYIISHDQFHTWTVNGGSITQSGTISQASWATILFLVAVPSDKVARTISLSVSHGDPNAPWTDDIVLANQVNSSNVSGSSFTGIPLGRTYTLSPSSSNAVGVTTHDNLWYSTDQVNWMPFTPNTQIVMGSFYFKAVFDIYGSADYRYNLQIATPPTDSPSQPYRVSTAMAYSPSTFTLQTTTPWHYPFNTYGGVSISISSTRTLIGSGGGPH